MESLFHNLLFLLNNMSQGSSHLREGSPTLYIMAADRPVAKGGTKDAFRCF